MLITSMVDTAESQCSWNFRFWSTWVRHCPMGLCDVQVDSGLLIPWRCCNAHQQDCKGKLTQLVVVGVHVGWLSQHRKDTPSTQPKLACTCRNANVLRLVQVQPSDPDFLPALGRAVIADGAYMMSNLVFNHGLNREDLPRTPCKLYDVKQAHKPFEADWSYARGYQDVNHASLFLWGEKPETTKTGVHVDWTVSHNVAFSTHAEVATLTHCFCLHHSCG